MHHQNPSRRPEYLKSVLEVLDEAGGELARGEVMEAVAARMKPTSHESERHEKTGYTRWRAALSFDSVRLVKAGWMRKRRGKWLLTEEGAKQLDRAADELFRDSMAQYRAWRQSRATEAERTLNDESAAEATDDSTVTFEQAVDLAGAGLRQHIARMNGFEFRDLVAALLRGMGYHTPWVAPPGKDGGIDIIAYRDPIGMQEPRIRVQVKHRSGTAAGAREIREFISLLNKQGDSGLFVSSGGFSKDAVAEVRHASVHIEMMDLEEFLRHWEDFYDSVAEADRALLPLRRIAFLAPEPD